MRYVIVDDDAAYRESHQRWLLDPSLLPSGGRGEGQGIESCDALTFEEALALQSRWLHYDVAVVDGMDRRSDAKRQAAATQADVPYRSYQRLLGVDVVLAAKEHHPKLLVIVTSTVVKINIYFARQMRGAGAEYVFSHDEIEEPADFVSRVCQPQRYAQRRVPGIEDRRLAQIPQLLADADPAARSQLLGAPARQFRGAQRRKTDRLTSQLREAFSLPEPGGPHRTHRQRIVPELRRLLGLSHEAFDTSPEDPYG
jgi:hypothetical protein